MDKTERLLRMMEHPDSYTDGQWQELLSDEQCRELYEAMRLSVSAFEAEDARQKIAEGIKDEEFQKLQAPLPVRRGRRYQVAAAFIGLLLLSGITYATIGSMQREQPARQAQAARQQETVPPSATDTHQATAIRVFENAELQDILTAIGQHYHVSVVYRNEASRHLRIYTKWDTTAPIAQIVERLNGFEKVHITRNGETIIID